MNKQKTTVTKRLPCRQGDVIAIPVDSVTGELEAAPKDSRGVVLAEGETSHHHHAVVGKSVKLMRFRDGRGDRLLEIGEGGGEMQVIGGGSGDVPRHHPVALTSGKWIIRVQKSWDSSRVRQVAD